MTDNSTTEIGNGVTTPPIPKALSDAYGGAKPWMESIWMAASPDRMDWASLDDKSFERLMRIREVEASEAIAQEIERLGTGLVAALKGELKVLQVIKPPDWLTMDEVAKKIGVSIKTLRGYMAPSQIANIRYGKIHIFFVRTLQRLANEAKARKDNARNKGGHSENLKNQGRKKKSI